MFRSPFYSKYNTSPNTPPLILQKSRDTDYKGLDLSPIFRARDAFTDTLTEVVASLKKPSSDLNSRIDALEQVAQLKYCAKQAIERARRRRLRRGGYVWMTVRPMVLLQSLVFYSAVTAGFDVFCYWPLMELIVLEEKEEEGEKVAMQPHSHLISGTALAARTTRIQETGLMSMSLHQRPMSTLFQDAMARDSTPRNNTRFSGRTSLIPPRESVQAN